MSNARYLPLALIAAIGGCKLPCGTGRCGPTTAAPIWSLGGAGELVGADRVCALGFSGPGYPGSPYPRQLAEERATRELAGVFAAAVIEAQIVISDSNGIVSMEYARGVEITEAQRRRIAERADLETWLDERGDGIYGEVGFTYARACAPARLALDQIADGAARRRAADVLAAHAPLSGGQVPEWVRVPEDVNRKATCAVGFSEPTYYIEEGVEHAADQVRGMFAGASQSVVMQDVDDRAICADDRCRGTLRERLYASNEAVSRGVVIERVWFDRDGDGPRGQARTTYALGCAWPVVSG